MADSCTVPWSHAEQPMPGGSLCYQEIPFPAQLYALLTPVGLSVTAPEFHHKTALTTLKHVVYTRSCCRPIVSTSS